MAVGVRAGDLIEVIDEANEVVLVFPDQAALNDYERSELDPSIPFDFARIAQQALDLQDRLGFFLAELRTMHGR